MTKRNQVPGFKRWKKDRKHLIRILLVMSLSFFLMEFSFLLGDSLETTLDERRKDAYGEWQFALLNMDASQGEGHTMELNPFLEHSGYLWSQAMLANEGLGADYGVGGIDADAVGISRIQVLEGHLPEQAREAAVEASVLNYLGSDIHIGDTIRLILDPVDARGKRVEDAETQSITVTLCGILSDYSANWCISNRALLPSVLMTEESFAGWESSPYRCFLMKGDEDWDLDEMEGDLHRYQTQGPIKYDSLTEVYQRLDELHGKLVRNEYAYPSNPVNSIETVLNAVRILGGVMAAVILGITVFSSVCSRQEEWRSLTLLGADRQRLRGLLFQEALGFALVSVILGVGGAFLGFVLFLPLSSSLLGFSLSYHLSWPHLLAAIGIGGGMVGMAYLLPFLKMKSLSRLHVPARKKKKKVRIRKGRVGGAVTFGTLWRRQWLHQPWIAVAQLFIMCGALILPGIGIRIIRGQSNYLNATMELQGNSYSLTPFSYNLDYAYGIPKESVKDLERIYGVSDFEAYQDTNPEQSFLIDISSWSGTEYYRIKAESALQALQDNLESKEAFEDAMEENRDETRDNVYTAQIEDTNMEKSHLQDLKTQLNQGKVSTRILTVNSEAALQPFLDNLDEGSVNLEDFWAGKSAILTLPAYLEPPKQNEYTLKSMYNAFVESQIQEAHAEGRQVVTEETIPAGISLPVTYQTKKGESETYKVRIDGILRDIRKEDDHLSPLGIILSGYGLICSEAFLEQFSWPSVTHYQVVRVNASQEAGYGTDTQVARTLSESSLLEYTNHREQIEQIRQELYLDLILYGTLCGLGTLLLLLILSGLTKNSRQYQQDALETLSLLGMKASWGHILQLSRSLLLAIAASGGAALGLSAIHYAEYYMSRIEYEDPIETIMPFFTYFKFSHVGFNLKMYVALCVIMGILCIAVSCGVSFKRTKNDNGNQ